MSCRDQTLDRDRCASDDVLPLAEALSHVASLRTHFEKITNFPDHSLDLVCIRSHDNLMHSSQAQPMKDESMAMRGTNRTSFQGNAQALRCFRSLG